MDLGAGTNLGAGMDLGAVMERRFFSIKNRFINRVLRYFVCMFLSPLSGYKNFKSRRRPINNCFTF